MTFRIQKTKSASPSIQIFYGKKYFLKCWLANDRSLEAKGLDYEIQMYARINEKILDIYPHAPFVRYDRNGTLSVKNILQMIRDEIGRSLTSENIMWFYGALMYTISGKKIPDKDRCIAKYNINRRSNVARGIDNYLLKFARTFDCGNCCEYFDVLKDGNSQQVAWGLVNVANGIFHLHGNGMVHNDLHAGNVLVNKDFSTIHIFDYDRGYMERRRNPLIELPNLIKASQANIIKSFPTDFYKLLYYVFSTGRINILYDLLNINDPNQKIFIRNYFTRYGPFFCENRGNSVDCHRSVLLSDHRDTLLLKELIGKNIGRIQEKVRRNFLDKYARDKRNFFSNKIKQLDEEEKKEVSPRVLERQADQAKRFAEQMAARRRLDHIVREEGARKQHREIMERLARMIERKRAEQVKKDQTEISKKLAPIIIFEDEKTVIFNVSGNKHPYFDTNAPKPVVKRIVTAGKGKNRKFRFAQFGATRVLPPKSLIKEIPDIRPKSGSKIRTYKSLEQLLEDKENFEIKPKPAYKGPIYYKKGEKGYTDVEYVYDFNTKFLAIFI